MHGIGANGQGIICNISESWFILSIATHGFKCAREGIPYHTTHSFENLATSTNVLDYFSTNYDSPPSHVSRHCISIDRPYITLHVRSYNLTCMSAGFFAAWPGTKVKNTRKHLRNIYMLLPMPPQYTYTDTCTYWSSSQNCPMKTVCPKLYYSLVIGIFFDTRYINECIQDTNDAKSSPIPYIYIYKYIFAGDIH